MLEILHIIYSSNFLLTYATINTVMILFIVVFVIWDYIILNKPFWDIEKKYKKELQQLKNRK